MKYDALGKSQFREKFPESFEIMKNISRKNDENFVEKYFSPKDCTMIPGAFRNLLGTSATFLKDYSK